MKYWKIQGVFFRFCVFLGYSAFSYEDYWHVLSRKKSSVDFHYALRKKEKKKKPHPFQLGNEISFDSDIDIISPQHRIVCGNS